MIDFEKDMKMVLNGFVKSPGTMSHADCLLVKKFLLKYKEYRDLYRESFGGDAPQFTIESKLDSVNWYINFHAKKEGKQ